MLLGVLVYGYAIAVLTATLANLDGPRVEFQDRLFALKNFMEHNKMAETVRNISCSYHLSQGKMKKMMVRVRRFWVLQVKQRAMDSVALLWTISKGEDVPGVKSMTHDLPGSINTPIKLFLL